MFGACARAQSVNKKNSESSPINNIALFNTAEFKLTTSEVKKTSAMFYPLSGWLLTLIAVYVLLKEKNISYKIILQSAETPK